jgi:hypothetical protein
VIGPENDDRLRIEMLNEGANLLDAGLDFIERGAAWIDVT